MIEKDTELMHSKIHSIRLEWKLILSIIFSKKDHSTLSYVLLMSNLKGHTTSFAIFVIFHAVESFESNKNIVRDQAVFCKGTLMFCNDLWYNFF